jgi:hypothetical protein
VFPCLQVSLVSSRSNQLDGFPLDDLFKECNRLFDLDVDNDLLLGEAGRNFVVATVFPSREVCLLFCFSCCLNAESSELIMFSAACLARFTRMASSSLGILLVFWGTLQYVDCCLFAPCVHLRTQSIVTM